MNDSHQLEKHRTGAIRFSIVFSGVHHQRYRGVLQVVHGIACLAGRRRLESTVSRGRELANCMPKGAHRVGLDHVFFLFLPLCLR